MEFIREYLITWIWWLQTTMWVLEPHLSLLQEQPMLLTVEPPQPFLSLCASPLVSWLTVPSTVLALLVALLYYLGTNDKQDTCDSHRCSSALLLCFLFAVVSMT